MNRTLARFSVVLLFCIFPFPGSLCLEEKDVAVSQDPLARNAPEPLWVFDDTENDYISTPVLALRQALREQIRKERDRGTLQRDREASERADREIPHYREAWLRDTSKDETFSPEVRRLRQELRDQVGREYAEHFPRTREMQEAQHERSVMVQRARVTLKGTVMDEHGNPLMGVGVTVLERHETFVGDSENKPETNITRNVRVEGDFSIVCDDVNAVFLTFRANGYFQEGRRYFVPHPPLYLPLEKGKEKVFDKIRVVMKRAGQRAKLRRYNATLISYLDGPASVGDLSLLGGQKSDISREVSRGDSVAFPRIYAEVGYPDGRPIPSDSTQFVRDIWSGVAEVSLCLEDSVDSGLILVDPGEKYLPQTMEDLAEAPVEGYQSHVKFTPEQVNRYRSGRALPFVIKVGSRYGKGGVYYILYEKPFGVRLATELNMQNDGSRNLLTRQ